MFGFFILLTSLSIITQQQSFTFDFNILRPDPTFESHCYHIFLSTTNLKIGTPYQEIEIQFDPSTFLTMFLDKQYQLSNTSTYFSDQLSSTYLKLISYAFGQEKIQSGQQSKDKMKFGSIEIDDLFFFLATHWIDEQKYSSIGLSYDYGSRNFPYNFLRQLNESNIIPKAQYSIEFIGTNKGRIVIGEDDTIQYNDKNSNSDYQKYFECNINENILLYQYYKTKSVQLIKNEVITIVKKNIDTVFDESFGFIQMPLSTRPYIDNHYIKPLNCKEMYSPLMPKKLKYNAYYYYICNKNIVLTDDLPELHFNFNQGTLTLTKQHLFIEYNDNEVLFAIVIIDNESDPQWIIGAPILKHFKVVHNYKGKKIFLYKRIKGRDSATLNNRGKKIIMWVIIGINVMMIIGILINAIILFRIK